MFTDHQVQDVELNLVSLIEHLQETTATMCNLYGYVISYKDNCIIMYRCRLCIGRFTQISCIVFMVFGLLPLNPEKPERISGAS